jgi:hypothetical protein
VYITTRIRVSVNDNLCVRNKRLRAHTAVVLPSNARRKIKPKEKMLECVVLIKMITYKFVPLADDALGLKLAL